VLAWLVVNPMRFGGCGFLQAGPGSWIRAGLPGGGRTAQVPESKGGWSFAAEARRLAQVGCRTSAVTPRPRGKGRTRTNSLESGQSPPESPPIGEASGRAVTQGNALPTLAIRRPVVGFPPRLRSANCARHPKALLEAHRT